ncbi:MAG: DNA-binding transcriptional MerR regulator [Bradymonadia bacterium]|jgi:DNA-binding transcriptional MerR regulator
MKRDTPIGDTLTSGGLARAAGVGVETVRYYERRGLLPMPPRLASGRRVYPRTAVDRLLFIRQAQTLGFSLADILQLLALRASDDGCAEVEQLARHKLTDVRERIAALKRIEAALVEVVGRCAPGLTKCAVICALEDDAAGALKEIDDDMP